MVSTTHTERVAAAKNFVETWRGRGNEKQDTQAFWLDLCRDVLGMPDVSSNVLFENKTSRNGFIDVRIDDAKTFIEQKSAGISLDKPETRQGTPVTPFQQCKRYADDQPNSKRPDTIIVCNFDTFRIHDLNKEKPEENYVEFTLEELPEQIHLLGFLADPHAERMRREEKVSLQAGNLIAKLYSQLREQYSAPDSEASQHSLNVLCVRLVFCLFAEDEGLFEKNAFYKYIKNTSTRDIRRALNQLFEILDTPVDQRDPYDQEDFKDFPYVNGGLFRDRNVEIPPFTDEIKQILLEEVSAKTDWSQISPTIFGGVFESTLNPETRHKGGMHYTSAKNIHRVIDPLFLNDLTAELNEILDDKKLVGKRRISALTKFHDKIASLKFFDPACGSGNFLTETYLCLRRMEKTIIYHLEGGQSAMTFGDESLTKLKISLDQFYGIEINDFACAVATTALYIAKLQADTDIESLYQGLTKPLPLTDSAHIVNGNALTTDWNTVLPADKCNYVISNPPFLGARRTNKVQTQEIIDAFKHIGTTDKAGDMDYVAGWYAKAAHYANNTNVDCAFVSTNSICQGEQVAPIWQPLLALGFHILFAHDTFKWTTNTAGKAAAVHCIIVGFSQKIQPPVLYHYEDISGEPELLEPKRLSPYLRDLPDILVRSRETPLCDVPEMGIGNQPIDGGHYLFTPDEKDDFIKKEPVAKQYFRRWFGADEFLKQNERWALCLVDTDVSDWVDHPLILERIKRVKDDRAKSTRPGTRKLASTPTQYQVTNIPNTTSLFIPRVSSKNRKYIPMGFLESTDIASDAALIVPNGTMYELGVLQSRIHDAWIRVVAGTLKSDIRYSAGIVYNNFIWPTATEEQKEVVAGLMQKIIEARTHYKGKSLGQMYKSGKEWVFEELFNAHKELDNAVAQLYDIPNDATQNEIVEHLLQLYFAKISEIED